MQIIRRTSTAKDTDPLQRRIALSLALALLLATSGCMEPEGTGPAVSTTADGEGAEGAVTPAPLPGTAALPAGFTGPLLVDPALYGSPLEGPIFSGLEPRPDIFETRDIVRWRGQDTLAGIWVSHPDAPPAIRARFINPRTGRGADGALIRRAGAEAPLISSEAATALEIRPFRDTEIVIVAVDLPTVIAVGEPDDAEPVTEEAVLTAAAAGGAADADPLASAEIDDVVSNARIETAAATLPDDVEPDEASLPAIEAPEEPEVALAEAPQPVDEPDFLTEAEDAIDALQGPVTEEAPRTDAEIDTGTDAADGVFRWEEAEEADEPPQAQPEPVESATTDEATPPTLDDLQENRVIKIDGTPPEEPTELAEVAPDPVPAPVPVVTDEPAPVREPSAEPEPEPEVVEVAEAEPGNDPFELSFDEPDEPLEPAEETQDPIEDEPALARPFVQAGVFSVEDNARRVVANLREAGYDGRISNVTLGSGVAYRVVAGPFDSRERRRDATRLLRSLGIADAAPTRR